MPAEPPPITGADPSSFAASVLRDRHPVVVAHVLADVPLASSVHLELERLLQEPIVSPLPRDAHDHLDWDRWGAPYFGMSMFEVPFLWAENYFYRRLLEATGYYRPGPWRGIDPFAARKAAGAPEPAEVQALDKAQDDPAALVAASLWGNQADLGFRLTHGGDGGARRLVADDSAALWQVLERPGGTVCVVADNAGRELLPDLVLVDHLLRTGRAAKVELHVKPAPYFVSDALTADVLAELRRFPAGHATGERLWAALRSGAVELVTDAFYCAPLEFRDAPAGLAARFAAAKLTVLKGDLNYRRLAGDRWWPAETPFAQVTADFPGAVAALRTVKSDVVVGVDRDLAASLPASWRTSGAFAMIQVRA